MTVTAQNYFELFGLAEQISQCPKKIKERYIKLQQAHHPDRFAHASEHDKRLASDESAHINLAYKTLLDPVLRALYLLTLRGVEYHPEASVKLPPDFLMEQMALREQLADLKQSPRDAPLEAIRNSIKAKNQSLYQTLEDPLTEPSVALMSIQKMQFYAKLMQEVEALESAWHY